MEQKLLENSNTTLVSINQNWIMLAASGDYNSNTTLVSINRSCSSVSAIFSVIQIQLLFLLIKDLRICRQSMKRNSNTTLVSINQSIFHSPHQCIIIQIQLLFLLITNTATLGFAGGQIQIQLLFLLIIEQSDRNIVNF